MEEKENLRPEQEECFSMDDESRFQVLNEQQELISQQLKEININHGLPKIHGLSNEQKLLAQQHKEIQVTCTP